LAFISKWITPFHNREALGTAVMTPVTEFYSPRVYFEIDDDGFNSEALGTAVMAPVTVMLHDDGLQACTYCFGTGEKCRVSVYRRNILNTLNT
jgi:uncharacterized Zn-finger protein